MMRPGLAMMATVAAGLVALMAACSPSGSSTAVSAGKVAPISRLRVAVVQPGSGCARDAAGWSAGEKAYVAHLTARMALPVELCSYADESAAAKALAAGEVELAALAPAAFAPVRATVRPILTGREPFDLGRTEAVLAVATGSPLKRLEDADQARLVFAGSNPQRLDGPKATLASAGLPPATLDGATIVEGPLAAAALLRADPGRTAGFLSADWSRMCHGTGKGDEPCKDLRVIWRGRRQASRAWCARRDIPKESWARLVGIHVALYDENRMAAEWFAPGTREIEPTEATALDPARSGG